MSLKMTSISAKLNTTIAVKYSVARILGIKIFFPASIQSPIINSDNPNKERSNSSFGKKSRINIGKKPIHAIGLKYAATAG